MAPARDWTARSTIPGRLLRAGLLTALVDGLFSSGLSAVFYGSTVARLWQGVASTVTGPGAFEGGTPTVLLGILMHIGVAFTWSIAFLLLVLKAGWVRRLLAGRFGVLKVACLYGPSVWLVMSLAVIPLLTGRPPSITIRWWIQFFGHMVFVGLPIVASIGDPSASRADAPGGAVAA